MKEFRLIAIIITGILLFGCNDANKQSEGLNNLVLWESADVGMSVTDILNNFPEAHYVTAKAAQRHNNMLELLKIDRRIISGAIWSVGFWLEGESLKEVRLSCVSGNNELVADIQLALTEKYGKPVHRQNLKYFTKLKWLHQGLDVSMVYQKNEDGFADGVMSIAYSRQIESAMNSL